MKSGDGSGTVTSDPPGIDMACDPACPDAQAEFPAGSTVTLTATPADGSLFALWTGDCEETAQSPMVATARMTGDRECDARFGREATIRMALYGVTPFSYGVESFAQVQRIAGAAQDPAGQGSTAPQQSSRDDQLVTIAFASGDAYLVDFADPSNPSVVDTLQGFCPGARSLALYDSAFAGPDIDATFVALSTDDRTSCSNGVPFGVSGYADLGTAPGGVDGVPGTHKYAWADFEGAIFGNGLWIEDASSANDDFFVALSGAERSCPFSVAVSNDETAYVVGREGAAGTSTEGCDDWRVLWIVDLTTRQVVDTVELGAKPRNLALSPDGGLGYIADFEEDAVYVVDLAGRSVARTIAVGDGPTDVAITPDGAHMAVTNWNADRVQLIDLGTDAVVAGAASGGSKPVALDFNADGTVLIVAHFGDGGDSGGLAFFDVRVP